MLMPVEDYAWKSHITFLNS